MELKSCVLMLVMLVMAVMAVSAQRTARQAFPQNNQSRCSGGQECKRIENCLSLAALLRNPSRANIRRIQQNLCGFARDRHPLVCCSDNGIILPTPPTRPTPQPTQPTQPTPRPTQPTPRPTQPTQPTQPPSNNGNLLPNSCGIPGTNTRIFFGDDSLLGAYPWMALLGFTSRFQSEVVWGCGGALITSRYVLTAGHCTSPQFTFSRDLTVIRLGEHNIGTTKDCEQQGSQRVCSLPFQEFTPVDIIRHETFNTRGTVSDDIALIRLDRAVQINGFVGPVCLPALNLDVGAFLSGRQVIVSGWGVTERGPETQILQDVSIPFVDRDTCNPFYNNGLLREQTCFGGDGRRDSCFGDSGGPVVATSSGTKVYTLLGMVSFGQPSCGVVGVPAVYTDVSSYRNWILNNLRP